MCDQRFLKMEREIVANRDVGFNQLRVSASLLWVFSKTSSSSLFKMLVSLTRIFISWRVAVWVTFSPQLIDATVFESCSPGDPPPLSSHYLGFLADLDGEGIILFINQFSVLSGPAHSSKLLAEEA